MASARDTATFLHELASRTTIELWKAARREPNVANLVFANHRGREAHRVSEQEARCIAQRLITESGYYFSIETPTRGRFKFKAKEASPTRSAQHDLSLYTAPTPDTVIGHLEFKQGHKSEKDDKGVHEIYKDLVKLVDSGLDSLWFHSFPNPTRNEFRQLQKFFTAAIPRALAKAKADGGVRVVLALCSVIEQEAWISSPVPWSELARVAAGFPVASITHATEWARSQPDTTVATS